MKSQAAGAKSTTLGPFLTLVVLATSGRILQNRDQLATVETIPWRNCSATFECSPDFMAIRGNAISLGPFLTLILTLRCRNAIESRSAGVGKGIWQVAPFVRISTST